MTVEYQCPSIKLVHVGGLRIHLNMEITSHVCEQVVGWDQVGRSFGLTGNNACPISLRLPLKLYIIYLLQHWIHADDCYTLATVGTTVVRSCLRCLRLAVTTCPLHSGHSNSLWLAFQPGLFSREVGVDLSLKRHHPKLRILKDCKVLYSRPRHLHRPAR